MLTKTSFYDEKFEAQEFYDLDKFHEIVSLCLITIIIKEKEYKADILKSENIGFILIKSEIIDSVKVWD